MSTAGETLDSALKNAIIPDQEFLLQGSVLDSSLAVVIDRLRGLCDNADIVPETFRDHEAVYILKDFTAAPSPGPASQGVMLRVRRALDHPELPYQLRYVGYPELGSYPAVLRNCLDVPVSSNVSEFLQELGAKLDHEFITKGYIMKKGRIKVTVFKIFKAPAGVSTVPRESFEPLNMSHMIELSVLTTKTDLSVADDLRNLAEQLKPLVQLDRMDYRRL